MDNVRAQVNRLFSELNLFAPSMQIRRGHESTVEPHHHYWMYVDLSAGTFLVYPAYYETQPTVRNFIRRKIGSRTDDPQWQKAIIHHGDERQEYLIPFSLSFPAQVLWRFVDKSTADTSLLLTCGEQKHIACYIDRTHTQISSVVKIPLCEATEKNCKKEFSLLRHFEGNGIDIAPCGLKMGRIKGIGPGRSYVYAAQTYLEGESPKVLASHHIMALMDRLRLKDAYISLKALADETLRDAEHAHLERDMMSGLIDLLKRVHSTVLLPASLSHGDLRSSNLLQSSSGYLYAIDWEFARPKSLELLDVSQLFLEKHYADSDATSYAQIFRSGDMALIERYGRERFGDRMPPTDQIVALQFAQHLLDRYCGFGGVRTSKIKRLCRALHSEWPL